MTASADNRRQPIGQRFDPAPRVDDLERAQQGVIVGARAGEPQVVGEGAHEHVMLLGDQRDMAAQVVEGKLDEGHLANGDRSRTRWVNAGQQPTQCRLAGARRPNHREPFARTQVEVDAVQHIATGHIGVAHIGRVHVLVDRPLARRDTVARHVGHADHASE